MRALKKLVRKRIREARDERPARLYHYCDLNGLHGICMNRVLWCTDLTFTNDSNEVKHGMELIHKRLYFQAEKYKHTVIEENLKKLADNLTFWRSQLDIYIACFSEDKDNLSQWRAYGGGARGASIGMDIDQSFPNSFDEDINVMMGIVYDEGDQEDIIDTVIDCATKIYDRHRKNLSHSDQKANKLLKSIMRELYPLLLEISIYFKDPSFLDEKEWRLVLMREKSQGGVKTRVSSNFIIPYMEYYIDSNEIADDRIKVKEIVQGPQTDDERGLRSLEILVKQTDFSDIDINKSKIPYRG